MNKEEEINRIKICNKLYMDNHPGSICEHEEVNIDGSEWIYQGLFKINLNKGYRLTYVMLNWFMNDFIIINTDGYTADTMKQLFYETLPIDPITAKVDFWAKTKNKLHPLYLKFKSLGYKD